MLSEEVTSLTSSALLANRSMLFVAMFGLVAYPALGIYQSIVGASTSATQATILQARVAHDAFFNDVHQPNAEDEAEVLREFTSLT
jgi:uncharacterized membrane protein